MTTSPFWLNVHQSILEHLKSVLPQNSHQLTSPFGGEVKQPSVHFGVNQPGSLTPPLPNGSGIKWPPDHCRVKWPIHLPPSPKMARPFYPKIDFLRQNFCTHSNIMLCFTKVFSAKDQWKEVIAAQISSCHASHVHEDLLSIKVEGRYPNLIWWGGVCTA